MLSRSVSVGGQLALRSCRSRALAQAAPQDRWVVFQGNSPPLQDFSNARSYWWSKPTPLPVSSPHAPEPAATALEEPVASATSAQIANTAVAPSESVSQALSPDAVSNLAEVASNVVPPLQYGDFAALGLTSWWPSGIISWSFELLQVSTGMPWFYTIVAGTLLWRVALIPTALTSVRNSARLRPYTEQMKTLDEKAQGTKDRAVQMELMLKKQKLLEKAGVTLGSMFIPPFVQIVGNFGLFFAIKNMVQLPLPQLTQSGMWLLPDLTVTGDYIMPTLVLLLMNVQFSVMKKELDPSKPAMAHTMNVMRVATFATLPMMTWMPSGLWLSVLTGMMLSITQSGLLRVPAIRQALGIPAAPPMPPVTMRDTGRMVVEWYRRTRMEPATATNQRKVNWNTLPKSRR